MTQLQEIQFSCSADLEEIGTWGISPVKHLLEFMDIYIEENLRGQDQDVMVFFLFEFKDKIDEIEKAIYRFINAMRRKQGKAALKDSPGEQEKIGAFLKIMEDKLGADSKSFKAVVKALDAEAQESQKSE